MSSTQGRVLVFDAGLNIGDNLRSFGVLKAFTQAHPELEVVCWLTPEVGMKLGPLLHSAQALTRFFVHPRSPRETYVINRELIKIIKAKNKDWSWTSFPGGKGPDQEDYQIIIPTGEVWLSAKLLHNQSLEQAESINQGEFLAGLLGVDGEAVTQAQPLLGSRTEPGNYITVGLSRPDLHDPKQLPAARQKQVWQVLLESGADLVAVDYQGHTPPPKSTRVTDFRMGPLKEKIETMNRAAFHVGSDGGLIHFAAACGCPTIGFFRGPGPNPGLVFGPWPPLGAGGEHVFSHTFDQFLEQVRSRAAMLQGGITCPASA